MSLSWEQADTSPAGWHRHVCSPLLPPTRPQGRAQPWVKQGSAGVGQSLQHPEAWHRGGNGPLRHGAAPKCSHGRFGVPGVQLQAEARKAQQRSLQCPGKSPALNLSPGGGKQLGQAGTNRAAQSSGRGASGDMLLCSQVWCAATGRPGGCKGISAQPQETCFSPGFQHGDASFTHCHVVTLEQAAVLSPGFNLAEATDPCCSWDLRHVRAAERKRSHGVLAPTVTHLVWGDPG